MKERIPHWKTSVQILLMAKVCCYNQSSISCHHDWFVQFIKHKNTDIWRRSKNEVCKMEKPVKHFQLDQLCDKQNLTYRVTKDTITAMNRRKVLTEPFILTIMLLNPSTTVVCIGISSPIIYTHNTSNQTSPWLYTTCVLKQCPITKQETSHHVIYTLRIHCPGLDSRLSSLTRTMLTSLRKIGTMCT